MHAAGEYVHARYPRVQRSIRVDARDLVAVLGADLLEFTTDEPTTSAIRDRGTHQAVGFRMIGQVLGRGMIQCDAVREARVHFREFTAHVHIVGIARDGVYRPVGDPEAVHGGGRLGRNVRRCNGGSDQHTEREERMGNAAHVTKVVNGAGSALQCSQ